MPKHDLGFDPPLMNAAGSLGFSPDLHSLVDWSRLGAFVTNPISLLPRTPAKGIRTINYPGGFLLHTGYPNPGLTQILRRYAGHWEGSPVPVIVHLLVRSTEELSRMVRRLESVEGVSGLELGLPVEAGAELVAAVTHSATGELPIILRLPMEQAIKLAPVAIETGASAVSLAPARGVLISKTGELVSGRLYGPALLPQALHTVQELSRMGLPVIGAGGVYTLDNYQAMLSAGALAVQLDSVLWRWAGSLEKAF